MRYTVGLIFFALLQTTAVLAQNSYAQKQKGDFFGYWGYNRAAFTKSNITFTGKGYDFTLKDVEAYDRPTPFSFADYFKPANITIPQYNIRFGYYIRNNWNVSFGTDHMKYVMPQNGVVPIEGVINQPGNPFNGVYDANSTIALQDTFLTFEHTDGLNYVNIATEYFFDLYTTPNGKFGVSAFGGGGLGAMIPKSNVQLMNGERNDVFHLAGFGLHANAGVYLSFWRHFFFRTQAKGGLISMPDILTRPNDAPDRAKQNFWFDMWDFAIGWNWRF